MSPLKRLFTTYRLFPCHGGAACILTLHLASCTPGSIETAGVVDDLGRTVIIDDTPARIVSLSPAITEVLFDLGANDRLVGRTQWDVYPPEALNVPNVGEGMPPNVEAVAAVNPDLVVFYASEVNRRPIEQLAAIGITSFSVRIDLLEGLPDVIRKLGAVTRATSRAELVADEFQARLDSARAVPNRSARPVRVVIVTWDNPPIVIGGESFLDELIGFAGAENVFADIDAPSANVSIETIAARDPDVFLVTTGGGEVPPYATRPEWRVLRAVAEGRFAFVQGSEFEWPSIRSLNAVDRLRETIGTTAARPTVSQSR